MNSCSSEAHWYTVIEHYRRERAYATQVRCKIQWSFYNPVRVRRSTIQKAVRDQVESTWCKYGSHAPRRHVVSAPVLIASYTSHIVVLTRFISWYQVITGCFPLRSLFCTSYHCTRCITLLHDLCSVVKSICWHWFLSLEAYG